MERYQFIKLVVYNCINTLKSWWTAGTHTSFFSVLKVNCDDISHYQAI